MGHRQASEIFYLVHLNLPFGLFASLGARDL